VHVRFRATQAAPLRQPVSRGICPSCNTRRTVEVAEHHYVNVGFGSGRTKISTPAFSLYESFKVKTPMTSNAILPNYDSFRCGRSFLDEYFQENCSIPVLSNRLLRLHWNSGLVCAGTGGRVLIGKGGGIHWVCTQLVKFFSEVFGAWMVVAFQHTQVFVPRHR